jgi:hypothetical protein
MSEAEWEFRKTEPMVNAGPLNLRPLSDSHWYRTGGAANVSLSIGFYFYQLPIVPLGLAAQLSPGFPLPSHLDMLPKSHFFHRSHTMKTRVTDYIRHPLFFYMNTAYLPPRLTRLKDVAMHWRNNKEEEVDEAAFLTPQEEASSGFVFNFGGATLGNVRLNHLQFDDLS